MALAEAALATFLVATPSGWVLAIAGLGVAAGAAAASIYSDRIIKEE